MTKKASFTIDVAEKASFPGSTGSSIGTASSAGGSRFNFTVSKESFRQGKILEAISPLRLHKPGRGGA